MMPFPMSDAKSLPLFLASLCLIAFPIGLSRLMTVDDPQRLGLAVLGVTFWMVVVWLGVLSIATNSTNDLRRSRPLHRRTILQLLLFTCGIVLMLAAIALPHGTA